MDLLGFISKLGSSDLYSFCLCLEAYLDHAFKHSIEDIGFDKSNGSFYILLYNGISITSAFGQKVEYTTLNLDDDDSNPYDDHEKTFNTYYEAENYLNSMV